jgi:type VI secretion system protein ImpH
MAGPERKSDTALIEALHTEASRFDFFRAVQLLHRLHPGSVPVGETGPVGDEPIRFAHDPSLTFHAGDISAIQPRWERQGRIFAKVTTTFLGLTGAASPLAPFMTEEVFRADQADDSSLREFYDLFHHRVLSLLYRAWKKYRFEAGFRSDASDAFTKRAMCFVGVDVAGALPRHGLPPGDLLALAPIIGQRTRPARSLQVVLERLFDGASVQVESFVARRVRVNEQERALLGLQNSTLGQDFTIGKTVIDRSGAFRVVVGPVGYELFEAFLPGGRHHDRLKRIVDQFSGGVLEPELELRLDKEAAPRFQLGKERGGVLGKNTHLARADEKPMRVRVVLGENTGDAKPRVVYEDGTEPMPAAAE